MKNRGFTLIEILVVITIMGIILMIAVPNYNETMTKSKIEKQTKELHSLIVSARLAAMQTKRPGAIFLGPQQCIHRVYTSVIYPTSTVFKVVDNTTFPFVMKRKATTGTTLNDLDVTSDNITFDTRGFTDIDKTTLVVTPLKYSGGNDCVVIYTSRTNIGRMENASTCSVR
jgi:prepilin-type N-terminal cleavage/methylation domain-containing protein